MNRGRKQFQKMRFAIKKSVANISTLYEGSLGFEQKYAKTL